jgi:peptidoglycan/LPS O-acetylase OafA/YrhL
MSRNQFLLLVTLLACAAAVLSVWMVASLDKQGHPHIAGDPVIAALLLLPYVLIAAVALWNRKRGIVIAAGLLTVIAIAAVAIPTLWNDHQARRRELPGREVQHYVLVAVLLIHWVGMGVLLALVLAHHLITRRSARPTRAAGDGSGFNRKDANT